MSGKAKIIRKIVFDAEVRNESPLQISSGIDDGLTDILILKNKDGQAYIPGTSLTGVLRDEISGIYGREAAGRLFGAIDTGADSQSMITINDIILENADIIVRDGVAIDELTGVGRKGAKFDYEALERGACGRLHMEMTIRQADEEPGRDCIKPVHKDFAAKGDVYGDMAASIADIITGGIKLGALTAKGYGRVASVSPAVFYDFVFTDSAAAQAWLDFITGGSLPGKPSYEGSAGSAAKAAEDLYITLDCALKSSLLVREYDVDAAHAADKIMAVQMKSGSDYVIPGTSVKGVLRGRAYKMLLDMCGDENKTQKFLGSVMGWSADNDKKGVKSRLEVDEIYIKPDKLQAMKHSRNRIDRFTGGTVESALFTEEPVWQQDKDKTTLTFRLRVKECTEAEAGLMLLLVKDIWLGSLCVGAGKSIGRGVMSGRRCTIDYRGSSWTIDGSSSFSVEGDKEQLEKYVEALGGEMNGKQ